MPQHFQNAINEIKERQITRLKAEIAELEAFITLCQCKDTKSAMTRIRDQLVDKIGMLRAETIRRHAA